MIGDTSDWLIDWALDWNLGKAASKTTHPGVSIRFLHPEQPLFCIIFFFAAMYFLSDGGTQQQGGAATASSRTAFFLRSQSFVSFWDDCEFQGYKDKKFLTTDISIFAHVFPPFFQEDRLKQDTASWKNLCPGFSVKFFPFVTCSSTNSSAREFYGRLGCMCPYCDVLSGCLKQSATLFKPKSRRLREKRLSIN